MTESTTPAPGAPITPVAGSALSDLFNSPKVRHAASVALSVLLSLAAAYASAKLGFPIVPPTIAAE